MRSSDFSVLCLIGSANNRRREQSCANAAGNVSGVSLSTKTFTLLGTDLKTIFKNTGSRKKLLRHNRQVSKCAGKTRSTETRFSAVVMIFFHLNELGSPVCVQFKASLFRF